MKIAMVYPHSAIPVPPIDLFDALAIVTYEISHRLARSDEIVIYPKRRSGEREEETHEGVRIHRVPVLPDQILNETRIFDRWRDPERPYRSSSFYYPFYARRVARQLARERCRIIHVHNFTAFIPVFRAAAPEARIVLHVHDHALLDFDRDRYRERLRRASLILACSRFLAEAIRSRFPEVADRCHPLHNGVDLNAFAPRPEEARGSEKRILFVGRLSPEKGVHVLLEAFRQVGARYPDLRLDLIGPSALAPKQFVDPFDRDPHLVAVKGFYRDAGSYLAHLRSLVPGEIGARVSFLGPVPNSSLVEHYRRSDIFVFPSLWQEPFGMPIVEAMGVGLPVIATRSGAFPETVEDGTTGLLVPRGAARELAAAFERLLGDDALRRRMGEAGRRRAEALFSWDDKVDELRRLYQGIA